MSKRRAVALLCVASCGRLGFEASHRDGSTDGTDADTPLRWVKTVVASGQSGSATTQTVNVQAANTGDAVVLHVFCGTGTVPTAVAVSATGWTFHQVGAITGSAVAGNWAASFGAIAPNTDTAAITVWWGLSASCNFMNALGDEFANNDPTGGTTTFDGHAEAQGNGSCATSLVIAHDNDAVWAACTSNIDATSPGPGYTLGADDRMGDLAAFAITTDPAGTTEPVIFNNVGDFVTTAVSIAPR